VAGSHQRPWPPEDQIGLDTNYRPSGWSSPADAAQAMDAIGDIADIVFATFDDEAAMHGCRSADEASSRLADLGVPEIVVKSGADGVLVVTDRQTAHVPATPIDRTVDTIAAGDAFAGATLLPGFAMSRRHRRPTSPPTSPRPWSHTLAQSSPRPSR
jgi:2-dehydro-3-deoxygluconokinase